MPQRHIFSDATQIALTNPVIGSLHLDIPNILQSSCRDDEEAKLTKISGFISIRAQEGKASSTWPKALPIDAILVLIASKDTPDTTFSSTTSTTFLDPFLDEVMDDEYASRVLAKTALRPSVISWKSGDSQYVTIQNGVLRYSLTPKKNEPIKSTQDITGITYMLYIVLRRNTELDVTTTIDVLGFHTLDYTVSRRKLNLSS